MSLAKYIQENQSEIDAYVSYMTGDRSLQLSNLQRRLWVLQTESLLKAALAKGVVID